MGAVKAKQKVESGLRYSSNASIEKPLGRSARQEKLNFEYSEEIQLGADDFSEIELSKEVKLIMNNTAPTMILRSFLRFRHHSQLLQSMSILQVIPMSDAIWDGETSFLLKMLFVLRR